MQSQEEIKIAAVQMASSENKPGNILTAMRMAEKAIAKGARFIIFPETFNFRGEYRKVAKIAEEIPGPSLEPFREIAARSGVCILAGSIYEKIKGSRKVFNTSVLIDEQGKIKAIYRKMHLFNVCMNGKKNSESKILAAGRKPVLVSVLGLKIGLSICYDLRFPELYRRYSAGRAEALCVPSAFTWLTGKAHWEVLLRARAIENQCYVIAPNQCGCSSDGIRVYGNSMIIDPWGRIIARASENQPEVIYARINLSALKSIRNNFPCLKQRIIC